MPTTIHDDGLDWQPVATTASPRAPAHGSISNDGLDWQPVKSPTLGEDLSGLFHRSVNALDAGTASALRGLGDIGREVSGSGMPTGLTIGGNPVLTGADGNATPLLTRAAKTVRGLGEDYAQAAPENYRIATAQPLSQNHSVLNVADKATGLLGMAAPAVASLVNPYAGIAAFGVQGEGAGRAEGEARVDALSGQQLAAVPRYQELLKQSGNPKAAREQLRAESGKDAGIGGLLEGIALGYANKIPGVSKLGDVLGNGLSRVVGRTAGNAIGHGVGEGATFAGINAGSQAVNNVASVVPTPTMQGVEESALTGFLGGALMGGGRSLLADAAGGFRRGRGTQGENVGPGSDDNGFDWKGAFNQSGERGGRTDGANAEPESFTVNPLALPAPRPPETGVVDASPVDPVAPTPLPAAATNARPTVVAPAAENSTGNQVVRLPVADLKLSADVPQFKKGADNKGVVEPLRGDFDERGVGPIQVWRRNDGRMEVISGRHRLDLARRTGKKDISAQIYNEADGVDKEQAAALDAELNIRDGQGSVADYVQYFQRPAFEGPEGQEAAESRGLLARSSGKRAYTIARQGSPELVAAHRAGIVSDDAAQKVAAAAPNNQALQALGMNVLQQGKPIGIAANAMRAAQTVVGPDATQGDLLGFDDSAIKNLMAMSRAAFAKQRELGERIAAVQGAAKRPAKARALGVDVKDPEAVKAKVLQLKAERDQWDHWQTDPGLTSQVRSLAGLEARTPTVTSAAPVPAAQPDGFALDGNAVAPVDDTATQPPVTGDQSLSFLPGPTSMEINRAAIAAKDAARNGLVGGNADTGDGGLFDGSRPEQAQLPEVAQVGPVSNDVSTPRDARETTAEGHVPVPVPAQSDSIDTALRAYGYSLHDGNIVTPSGKVTHVRVRERGQRVRIEGAEGALLWSGTPSGIGKFLEKFWFAKPVAKAVKTAKGGDVYHGFLIDQGEPKRSTPHEQERASGVPVHLPASPTGATRRFDQRFNGWRRKARLPGNIRTAEIPKNELPDSVDQALRGIERALGIHAHVIRNLTPEVDSLNGISFRDGKDVFVDERSQNPVTTTALHEFVHTLRGSDPDLYQALEDEVRRQGLIEKYLAWRDGAANGENVDYALAVEELTADAVGDALTDPGFLERIARRNPSMFRELAQRIMAFLDSLLGKVRNLGSNAYLEDVAAFRDKLADVLDELAARRKAGRSADASDRDIRHSRRRPSVIDRLIGGGTDKAHTGVTEGKIESAKDVDAMIARGEISSEIADKLKRFLNHGNETEKAGSVRERRAGNQVYVGLGGTVPKSGWMVATVAKDEQGQPLTLYRGSRDGHTYTQDFEQLGAASGNPSAHLGLFLTNDRGEAAGYGTVGEYALDLRKPKVYDIADLPGLDDAGEAIALRRELIAEGHDGIVLDARPYGGPVQYVAFKPEQVMVRNHRAPAVDNDEGSATLSRAAPMDRAALDDDAVRSIATDVLGAGPVARRVVVVPWSALPKAVRNAAASQGASPAEVRGVYWRGRTYLVSGRFHNENDVVETLYHEHYGHFGLRVLYGKEIGPRVARMVSKAGGIAGIRNLAQQQGIDLSAYEAGIVGNPKMSPEQQRFALMDELLAHMAQATGALRRIIEEYWGMVRAFLRKHAFAKLAGLTPADLAVVLRRARQAVQREVKQGEPAFVTGQPEPAMARTDATRSRYEQRIDELFDGGKPSAQGVRLLDRGDVLDMVGYGDMPVVLNETHGFDAGRYNHPLSREAWKKMPEWIDNPAAVFERTSDGHLTLIGPEKVNGHAVVIGIEPKSFPVQRIPRGNTAGRHLVLTAYEKDRGVLNLDSLIETRHVKPLYIDQRKTPRFYMDSGLKFSGSAAKLREFNGTLKTGRDLVKYRATHPFDTDSTPAMSRLGQGGTAGGVDDAGPMFSRKPDDMTDAQASAMGKMGGHPEPIPLKSAIARITDRAGEKLIQGIVDQFDPIKRLDMTAYMQARLSKGIDGALEATFLHGTPFLRDGALDIERDGQGFRGVLADLNGEGERFLAWIAGNRSYALSREWVVKQNSKVVGRFKDKAAANTAALGMLNEARHQAEMFGTPVPRFTAQADGREHLFNDDEIDGLRRLNEGTMQNGDARVPRYAKALARYRKYQKAVLDIAEQAGLVNPETRPVWESEFYVPFNRVMNDDDSLGYGTAAMGLARQRAIRDLKGGKNKLRDLLYNVLANWNMLLTASMRNLAAQGAIKAAVAQHLAIRIPSAERDSIWVMERGRQVHYRIDDPLLFTALDSLSYGGLKGRSMDVMRWFKHALTVGVTMSPTFRVRNLVRDTVSALAVSDDTGWNPVANIVSGFAATTHGSDTDVHLLAGGGKVRFGTLLDSDQARRAKELINAEIQDNQVLDTKAKTKAALRAAWDWWKEVGDRSESINRAVIYQNVRARGGNHLEASFNARDMLDFTMGGSSGTVRFLTSVIPFLNARLQGEYKLGRAAKHHAGRFAAVAGVVALMSAANYLLLKDDPDYKKLPDYIRDNYWVVKLGPMFVYIPKPFEIGAMGTVVERGTELATAGDDYKAKDFSKSLLNILSGQLAMNPIPQAVRPGLEAYMNFDMFRDRAIDTETETNRSPATRYTPSTSAGAIALGRATHLSPKRIDHMLRGYFGWLGTQALNVSDLLLRGPMGLPSSTRRDYTDVGNIPFVGDFVHDAKTAPSKYMDRFYQSQAEIEAIYQDARFHLRTGDQGAAMEGFENPAVRLHGMIYKDAHAFGKIRAQIRTIGNDRTLSAKEKNAKIDALYGMMGQIAEQADQIKRKVAD